MTRKQSTRNRAGGLVLAVLAAVALLAALDRGEAQSPATGMTRGDIATIRQIQDQQQKISANLEAMEKKMETIAEDVRQARIFASRGS